MKCWKWLVNSVAPFVLCNRLVKHLKRWYGKNTIIMYLQWRGNPPVSTKESPITTIWQSCTWNMMTATFCRSNTKIREFTPSRRLRLVDWLRSCGVRQKRSKVLHDFQASTRLSSNGAASCDGHYLRGNQSGKIGMGKFLKDYKRRVVGAAHCEKRGTSDESNSPQGMSTLPMSRIEIKTKKNS